MYSGVVITFAIGCIVLFYIIDKARSPLSHVPGPFWTRLTALPVIIKDSYGLRTIWTNDLHLRYGAVVRLGPNEISIKSRNAIQEVYSGSVKSGYYSKGFIYSIFKHYSETNTFSALTYEDCSWRRRASASSYLSSTVLAHELRCGGVWRLCTQLIGYVANEGFQVPQLSPFNRVIDVGKVARYYASDCITEYILGDGTQALVGDPESRAILDDITTQPGDALTYALIMMLPYYAIRSRVFQCLRRFRVITGSLSASNSKHQSPRGRQFRSFILRKFESWHARVKGGYVPTFDDPVAAHLACMVKLRNRDNYLDIGFDADVKVPRDDHCERRLFSRPEAAASECVDQFLAGVETIADSLCYAIFALSDLCATKPQRQLRAEIAGFDLNLNMPLDKAGLRRVLDAPVLNAVLMETFRLYPATTVSMHRVVPLGGRYLDGHFIPAGVTVGGSTYTANRDPAVFDCNGTHDVSRWLPQRWLESKFSDLVAMEHRLWTFGSGDRGCPGRFVAVVQLKIALAAIYSRYTTSLVDGLDPADTSYHWSTRTTFRDVQYFEGSNGYVAFHDTNEVDEL